MTIWYETWFSFTVWWCDIDVLSIFFLVANCIVANRWRVSHAICIRQVSRTTVFPVITPCFLDPCTPIYSRIKTSIIFQCYTTESSKSNTDLNEQNVPHYGIKSRWNMCWKFKQIAPFTDLTINESFLLLCHILVIAFHVSVNTYWNIWKSHLCLLSRCTKVLIHRCIYLYSFVSDS